MSTPAGRAMATQGPVLIVGTGLLGTSLGLCLQSGGVSVYLSDISPTSERLSADMGAGIPVGADVLLRGDEALRERGQFVSPSLVVVATPPDVAGATAVEALRRFPEAVVTDIASIKSTVMQDVMEGAEAAANPKLVMRYVGSHPMAGRERSGAGAGDGDLFVGRPWVLVAPPGCDEHALLTVRTLAMDVGSMPLEMSAATHDQSVALVSHVPQLVSSLLAARLAEVPVEVLSLAGQGLRDTTRIAASDPRLWTAIIAGNARPIMEVLHALREDVDVLLRHLDAAVSLGRLEGGSVGAINRVMTQGNRGVSRIPGKHGEAPRRYAELEVLVPDEPGRLGDLFSELGELGINIEDLALEHSAGQRVGVARLMVDPGVARQTEKNLEARGWRIIAHHSQ